METCSNCGNTLRPGAKFCTACGTRLNESTRASNEGWGRSRTNSGSDAQETSVIPAIRPQEPEKTNDPDPSFKDTWGNAYGAPAPASDDPASRFISALDNEVTPVTNEPETASPEPESTWGTPAPVFTPPPASNWSYSAQPDEPSQEAAEKPKTPEATWGTRAAWSSGESGDTDTPSEADTTGPARADEPIPQTAETLEPDEARDKAIALADELRRTIRMMSSGTGESDHGAAVMALTEASLQVGDFSDVRGVLADVRNDPRDIQALANLSRKIDRLDELLDEHKALADAIETAIKELNG